MKRYLMLVAGYALAVFQMAALAQNTAPAAQQLQCVLAKLRQLNPGFDGSAQHKIDNNQVIELLFSSADVKDISPVRALAGLRKLSCPGTRDKPTLTDISPLRGMSLTALNLQDTGVADLSPLTGCPLTFLDIRGTPALDFSPLANLKLKELRCDTAAAANKRAAQILMQIDTLESLNGKLAVDFLREIGSTLNIARPSTAPASSVGTVGATTSMPRATPAPTAPAKTIAPAAPARLPQSPAAFIPPTLSTGPERTMVTTTGMQLVWIPSGEFMMGSTPEERKWAGGAGCPNGVNKWEGEKPRRTRIANGFWLGRTEVTVANWRGFVIATAYVTDAERKGKETWRNPKSDFEVQDNQPVCCASWNDATAFCQWLTETEKKANRLPVGMVFRLPTEAEWEYACRAGSQTKFWWGDKPQDGDGRLNWHGSNDGFKFASPVDRFGARGRNRFGLADMLGSVWEWCLDEFDPAGAHEDCYKGNPDTRVMRGGSFSQFIGFERCATRSNKPPSVSFYHLGFRVCCGVPR